MQRSSKIVLSAAIFPEQAPGYGPRLPIKFSEIKNLPPITAERIEEIKAFKNTDFSDCPEMTDEDWRRAYLVTKMPKVDVHMRLDADVLGWLKAPGKGYQARLNAALRFRYIKYSGQEPRKL